MYDEIHLSKAWNVSDRRRHFRFRLQPPPPAPSRKQTNESGWGGFRKLFGLGRKEEPAPVDDYYAPEVSYLS